MLFWDKQGNDTVGGIFLYKKVTRGNFGIASGGNIRHDPFMLMHRRSKRCGRLAVV